MANLDKILLNNTFTLPAGFNIDSTEPIDSRFQVDTKEDLYKDWGNAKVTNKDGVNEAIYKYDGLITYVKSEGKSYRYNSSLLSDENLKGWELVPVLSDIPNAPVQGISVDGVEIEPDEDGIVNITLPEIPEYTLEAGDTNSVKLVKDGESAGEVSISLTADAVSAALLKATKENVGKIILVSGEPEDSEYLNGTYIIDGIGSVKYLATTTGSSAEASTEELIDNAIKELDSTISAEEGKFITGITITDGKLVSCTSGTITIPEAPEYTIQSAHPEGATKTTYTLLKDGAAVEGSIIEVNDSEITFKEGDIYIADKHVLITSDLDDYLVKDIKDGDVLLSLNSDGEVSSTISLKYETKTEGEGEEAVTYPVINLYGKDTTTPISTIDASEFIKDGFLSSASYDEENHKLTLTWNTDSDIKTPTVIDLSGLIDVHDVVGGDGADDLVKIVVEEKNENGVLTFTVSIDETNLQNKLDEINGAFIKSVVDNDTATYVKVNAATTDQVVTISVDETELSTKLGEIADKFSEIDGKFVESVTAPALDEQDTLVKVTINNDDSQNPVISLDDSVLDTKFDNYLPYEKIVTGEVAGDFINISLNVDENKELSVSFDETKLNERFDALVDADTKCTSATINVAEATTPETDEVDVISKQTIILTGETGESLETETPIASVKVVTKQYVDSKFESITDSDTKCTSATINVAEATTPETDEVDVIAKQQIVLTGETGESLETETPIASVKVVTKQYVDGKFAEVPTYTAITNDEIDALFV